MRILTSILLALALGTSPNINGQTWGSATKVSQFNRGKVLVKTADGYLGIHEQFRSQFVGSEAVFKLDAAGNVVASVDVNFKSVLKGLKYDHAIVLGNELIVMASLWDKKAKTKTCYAVPVNKADLSFGAAVELLNVASVAKLEAFNYDVSPDGTKLLVTGLGQTEADTLETVQLRMVAVNSELKTLWSVVKEVPAPLHHMEFLGAGIANDGRACAVRSLYIDQAHFLHQGNSQYMVDLIQVGPNGQSSTTQVDLEGQFMVMADVIPASNGQFIVGGVEGMHENPAIGGVAFITLSEAGVVEAHEFYNAGVQHQYYHITDVVEVETGDYALITQFYNEARQELYHDDGSVKEVVTNFTNNEIFLARFNGKNITTVHVLPVQNNSTNDRSMYAGYALRIVGDQLQFIYNDHPDNFDKKLGDPITPVHDDTYQDVQLVAVSVNVAAEEQRKVISVPEGDLMLQPASGLVDGDRLILTGVGDKGRKMQFGSVDL